MLEGIWSNETHPKDFPEAVWLTHFSDLIGASHRKNFTLWARDQIATDGFRQLAESGSTSGLEGELNLKAMSFKSFIKVPGLWYPNINSNSSTSFE